jgi:hypothetical protein
MSADAISLARHEWAEADRALHAARGDRARYESLLAQVDVLVDDLRKRVGGTYTLADLTAAYRDAETWARPLVEERAPSPGWPRDLALVIAAAFHQYQRGAADYAT